jgi:hypothetical protein
MSVSEGGKVNKEFTVKGVLAGAWYLNRLHVKRVGDRVDGKEKRWWIIIQKDVVQSSTFGMECCTKVRIVKGKGSWESIRVGVRIRVYRVREIE